MRDVIPSIVLPAFHLAPMPFDVQRTLLDGTPRAAAIVRFDTDEFPAFYRRSTGLPVDRRFDSMTELASAVRLHLSLGLGTGVLIANPIPVADEMASELYERALHTALSQAEARGVRGRAVTPFLLDRMRAVTGRDSVRANVALLRHNARVAAALAVAGV
jgi:pseudouridine-5'-phosphate glycosidase